MIEIEFPFIYPSYNRTKRWPSYRHRQWKDKIRKIVLQYVFENNPKPFSERVEVLYERHSSKELDRDNLYITSKYFVDMLVKARLIPDDSEKHIDLKCVNAKGKKTVIKIKKVDSE